MKRTVCASLLALSVMSLSATPSSKAQIGGPSAAGEFGFSAEDDRELTKTIVFSAATNRDGSASGEMTFSDPAEFPDQDVDGAGAEGFRGRLSDLRIEARFDCLVVEENRAVMSGVTTASTVGEYIGLRVLLVVEDNGDGTNPRAPDKLTWGIHKPPATGWVPTDAERRDDDGALLRWTATDAERDDDRGIPSHRSTVVGCQSFPLSSYSFVDIEAGNGDLQVRP